MAFIPCKIHPPTVLFGLAAATVDGLDPSFLVFLFFSLSFSFESLSESELMMSEFDNQTVKQTVEQTIKQTLIARNGGLVGSIDPPRAMSSLSSCEHRKAKRNLV